MTKYPWLARLLFFRSNVMVIESEALPDFRPLFEGIEILLRKLRYTSGQWTIGESPRAVSATLLPQSEVEYADIQIEDVHGAMIINSSAATLEHIREADLMSDDEIPVYHTLLGNAMLALRGGIYRSSIIYAAMAMEALAATAIETEFQRAKDAGEPHLNLTTISGKVTDPVYDTLMRNTSFTAYLHARSLYVLRRSMLEENKALYDKASILYKARNKIVHRGDMDDDAQQKLLTIDQEGCSQAIDTASDTFRWFRVPPRYEPGNLLVEHSKAIVAQSYIVGIEELILE